MGKKGIPARKPYYPRQSRLNTTHFVACAFSTGSLDQFHPPWQRFDSTGKWKKKKAVYEMASYAKQKQPVAVSVFSLK
jgi:hypothetical protein